jgi:hypothetical protein
VLAGLALFLAAWLLPICGGADAVALGKVQQLGPFKYPTPAGGTLRIGVTFEIGDGSVVESIPRIT